ncbi:hypothetical protein SCUP234_12364 [Seiridium cupressi]
MVVECIVGPHDVVIFVMGMTGVGKSTFISQLVDDDIGIGHGLNSHTATTSFHCLDLHDRRVYLVDTPGFNDTWRSDGETLQEIAYLLAQTYRGGLRLGGIAYLHSVAEPRVTGSAAKNFAMLGSLCGPTAAKHVTLVTTKWNLAGEDGTRREKELVENKKFLHHMYQSGSPVKRWTGDRDSACSIITDLLSRSDADPSLSLQIQQELVDDKLKLEHTSAGTKLAMGYENSIRKLRCDINEVCEELRRGKDALSLGLLEQKRQYEQSLEATKVARATLKERFEDMSGLNEIFYVEVLQNFRNEEELRRQAIEEGQRQVRELVRYYAENRRVYLEANRQAPNPVLRSLGNQYKRTQDSIRRRIQDTSTRILKEKKRSVMKRNLVPLLGCLAGLLTIAAGAATLQVPIIAVGVAITGTAGTKLDLSRSRITKKDNEAWDVAEFS